MEMILDIIGSEIVMGGVLLLMFGYGCLWMLKSTYDEVKRYEER